MLHRDDLTWRSRFSVVVCSVSISTNVDVAKTSGGLHQMNGHKCVGLMENKTFWKLVGAWYLAKPNWFASNSSAHRNKSRKWIDELQINGENSPHGMCPDIAYVMRVYDGMRFQPHMMHLPVPMAYMAQTTKPIPLPFRSTSLSLQLARTSGSSVCL